MVHYLDHAATTPMRPVALEAMWSVLNGPVGNPSGAHRVARHANRILDDARETMAELLGAEPGEIVFTGGGTEADNLAVFGVAGRPVCSAVEHHAVLTPVEDRDGVIVGVNPDGRIDLDALAEVLTDGGDEIGLVSVMTANNETGVIQPLAEVAQFVRGLASRARLHTDAVQAFAWMDLRPLAAKVDLLSLSAHKFGGPPGVGLLMVRRGTELLARARGGGQERERRSGSHNVAGIAAMAAAAAETDRERAATVTRVAAQRDRLEAAVASVPGCTVTAGGPATGGPPRTANIAHFCFENVDSEALLFLLEKHDVMASAASSCASGAMVASHVLAAMGVAPAWAAGSLRLSLGPTTTDADIDAAIAAIGPAVARLRERD